MASRRFTDGRVPDPGIRALFETGNRWQRWLDVEAALARAEAEAGIVPVEAADVIVTAAQLEALDMDRIQRRMDTMSHPLMPLIAELSEAAGEPHGGWVHWGATTQNITQTGDVLVLKDAHAVMLRMIGQVLAAAALLAERGAGMVMAGRTHGQHALPITFGFKAGVWIDELCRHVTRLRQAEERVFVAMAGGAVGTFASLGAAGPKVQARMASQLGLRPMAVPARTIADPFAEYVCVLAMLGATGGKIARECLTLMGTEFGEVAEPAPAGVVGSSTMPHKRNPQLSQDVIAIAAQVRSLVPLALEAMNHENEGDGACTTMMDEALSGACVLTGDLLVRLHVMLEGLRLDEDRMRSNLDLTGGLMGSEAVMLSLGSLIGRHHAHEVVSTAVRSAVETGRAFQDTLAGDPRIALHLSGDDVAKLLDSAQQTGLAAGMARDAAERAWSLAAELGEQYGTSTTPRDDAASRQPGGG